MKALNWTCWEDAKYHQVDKFREDRSDRKSDVQPTILCFRTGLPGYILDWVLPIKLFVDGLLNVGVRNQLRIVKEVEGGSRSSGILENVVEPG